jgi:hypothetical protein
MYDPIEGKEKMFVSQIGTNLTAWDYVPYVKNKSYKIRQPRKGILGIIGFTRDVYITPDIQGEEREKVFIRLIKILEQNEPGGEG